MDVTGGPEDQRMHDSRHSSEFPHFYRTTVEAAEGRDHCAVRERVEAPTPDSSLANPLPNSVAR
jgi:hypothetical protein